ncbi:MAG: membrane dipeptidase [bacterium]
MILDLHVDFIIQQRLFGYDALKRHGAGMKGQPLIWHADIPRMQEAGYSGACLGIHYYPWESEKGFVEMQKQIDYLDDVVAKHPDVMRIEKPADGEVARDNGTIGLAPGVEGAHMLNGQLNRVDTLRERNVAYMTITHFSKNVAATPSMGRGANEVDGLTGFGKDLIAALQDNDIIVDVAHVNTPGTLDICDITTKPLFCTHTGIKGVYPHARNITDPEIDGIARSNGVIGIMFAPKFLTGHVRVDHTCVLDHIDYVVQRVGINHIAIGSDFDGWVPIPNDMRDCRDIKLIEDGLAARGYSAEDILRITEVNARELLSGQR